MSVGERWGRAHDVGPIRDKLGTAYRQDTGLLSGPAEHGHGFTRCKSAAAADRLRALRNRRGLRQGFEQRARDTPCRDRPGRTSATRPATPDGRKPGFAAGRVLRQDGRPIAVEGMRIGVTVRGISDRTGQVVSYSPTVGADGRYEVKLEPGTYRPPAGVVEVPFNGRHYRFELDPVQRAAATFDANAGIHEDFVWHLSGPAPLPAARRTSPAPATGTAGRSRCATTPTARTSAAGSHRRRAARGRSSP